MESNVNKKVPGISWTNLIKKLNSEAEHRLKLLLEFYPVGENKRFIGRGERVGKLIEMGGIY